MSYLERLATALTIDTTIPFNKLQRVPPRFAPSTRLTFLFPPAADIADFELCLYDFNKAAIGGAKEEFVFSARIDNLMCSFTSLTVRATYALCAIMSAYRH